jgi:hypothetical protein
MVTAVTLEMSNGSRDDIVRSSISTSRVNTNPAMGALKIPDTAPAAPQPMSSIITFWSILKKLARLEPIAEPVNTIGDSAPTEPPKPMVIPLAMSDDHILCLFILPCLRDIE